MSSNYGLLLNSFNDHVDTIPQWTIDYAKRWNLRKLSCEEAWKAIENFTQGQKEWDNPPNIIFEQEVANLKAQAKRLFGNENVWVEMHRVPSFNEPEPQQNPLPNYPSLDVSLGEERGPEPPIKPYSPDSFRMKEVDSLTINTPPSVHVVTFHPKIRIAIITHALMILRNIMDLNQVY
ncbi:hypothetical protein Tco_1417866 [Tanacetum coccineum]